MAELTFDGIRKLFKLQDATLEEPMALQVLSLKHIEPNGSEKKAKLRYKFLMSCGNYKGLALILDKICQDMESQGDDTKLSEYDIISFKQFKCQK